jgi:hypothetical protein
MNRADLQAALLGAGVSPSALSPEGKIEHEAFVMERHSPTLWRVYYSERGLQTSQSWFGSEDEACRFIYRQLV